MKVEVTDTCIGCGACTAIASNVFEPTDEGTAKAVVEKVEEKDVEDVKDAMEGCPVGAIGEK